MGDTAAITAGAQATTGGVTAYSQYQSGKYNAKVERFNASVANAQAADAVRRGGESVQRFRKDVAKVKSAQRASFAAQGVVVDQDVAQAVADDTDAIAAEDERTIAMNATREAWGYRVQAVDHTNRATMGMNAARSDAIGTLMSTTGRFADSGYRAGWGEKKARPKPTSVYDSNKPVY